MIKIFSPTQTIYLISALPFNKIGKMAIITEVQSKDELHIKYSELAKNNDVNEIYFLNPDINKLLGYFSSLFRVIEAAGGLVNNGKDQWLFIFRNGKWDLPKGKIEKGEGIKTAAIREVQEECGIDKLSIIKKLSPTYHIYSIEKKEILKCTYWFEMLCKDNSKLVPQLEEGITEVKWIDLDNLKQVYDNTFESVKEVLKAL